MYTEPDYAESRIQGTIVRLEDEPVYVCSVQGDMTCRIKRNLNSEEEEEVHIDELNLLAPELGYVNLRGVAVYICRKPMRRDWRQGLRTSQVVDVTGIVGAFSKSDLMKCVKGVFLTKSKAIEKIREGGWRSAALSRSVALVKVRGGAVKVRYKWMEVGKVVDGKLVPDNKFKYLREVLEVFND